MSEQRGLFEVFRVHEWIAKDCPVKSCIDGVIPTDKGLYRCGECNRNHFMSLPVFRGFTPKFSDYELQQRKEDRKRVMEDADFRLRRGKELVKAITSIWSSSKKTKYISDEEVPF